MYLEEPLTFDSKTIPSRQERSESNIFAMSRVQKLKSLIEDEDEFIRSLPMRSLKNCDSGENQKAKVHH